MTTTTVLKPGDRVLVTFHDSASRDQVLQVIEQLRERFPDVEFTSLHGVESVIVQQSQEDSDG